MSKSILASPGLAKMASIRMLTGDTVKQLFSAPMANPNEGVYHYYMGPQLCATATNPATAREVLTKPDIYVKMRDEDNTSSLYEKLGWGGDLQGHDLVTSNGSTWQYLRKVLSPGFTAESLNLMKPNFVAPVNRLVDLWSDDARKNGGSCIIETRHEMSMFAMEVLCSTIFGVATNNALRGDFKIYDTYRFLLKELTNPLYLVVPSLQWLPLPRNKKLKAGVDEMYDYLQNFISSRKQCQRDEPRDLLDFIVGVKGVEGLEEKYIIPTLWVFFFAGHDTTATSLAWMWRFLARFPEYQERIRKEVMPFKGNSDPDVFLKECPLLNAFITEVLRLRPPVYNIPTRKAAVDTVLGDYKIPKGTIMGMHVATINRHYSVYGESGNVFSPERHLNPDKKVSNYANMPFAVGPRRCIGDRFSLLEQRLAIGHVLQNFKIEALPATKGIGVTNIQDDDDEYAKDNLPLLFCIPKQSPIRLTLL